MDEYEELYGVQDPACLETWFDCVLGSHIVESQTVQTLADQDERFAQHLVDSLDRFVSDDWGDVPGLVASANHRKVMSLWLASSKDWDTDTCQRRCDALKSSLGKTVAIYPWPVVHRHGISEMLLVVSTDYARDVTDFVLAWSFEELGGLFDEVCRD